MIVCRILPFLFLCLVAIVAQGQVIKGDVVDMDNKQPMGAVHIRNTYTSTEVETGENGLFLIAAEKGQLLEFKCPGYQTTRVRIPQGIVPPYFRIVMKHGFLDVKELYAALDRRTDYAYDSAKRRALYKHELDFPKMSTFDAIQHPFSAMSSRNRDIWNFQDDYYQLEQERYVDAKFNPETVSQFTGLTGDSLIVFMKRHRPTYSQAREMNDYTFYNFIKASLKRYRGGNTPRYSR